MKIKRGEYYCVDVYEESHNIYNHRKKHIGELKFTGLDLMKSLIPQLCWGEWNSWKR